MGTFYVSIVTINTIGGARSLKLRDETLWMVKNSGHMKNYTRLCTKGLPSKIFTNTKPDSLAAAVARAGA